MISYISLFLISFLAATILPLSSELTLASLLNTDNYNSLILIGAASLGNILGSIFNWLLGFYLLKCINKKWFPFKEGQIDSASRQFNKFGVWSLLFAWVPIIGDPLTLIAGILRVNFLLFLILVAVGKVSRYFIVFALIN
jgi:membrane protein YqaA with SNARE-associated domain|tara:strand:+ start:2765 stop:3184 length:420 start_codon:yes stop_codon:yes gene_type:complete